MKPTVTKSNTSRSEVLRSEPSAVAKLVANLPWLVRYPVWRAREFVRRATESTAQLHLILVVANHFEPAYNERPNEFGGFGVEVSIEEQLTQLDRWSVHARTIGESVHDHDETPFRHTNFYPAEQYHPLLLSRLADLQREGLGEVEVHLHHGINEPDTARNLRRVLVDFRDALAQEHKCLSREAEGGLPRYAFVHGNWALANSAGGRFCGVDEEMQVLAETGCYADLTLPSAPDVSQVPRINAIYQCGGPLNERMPHRFGANLKVGEAPRLPVILSGPLVFDWRRNKSLVPRPRLENGVLAQSAPLDLRRLNLWRNARIGILGRPDWIFIKLHCHAFFLEDQSTVIGERMRRFLEEVLDLADRTGAFKLHFASAREAFNMAMAATEGQDDEPHMYRNYRLRQIMHSESCHRVLEPINPSPKPAAI